MSKPLWTNLRIAKALHDAIGVSGTDEEWLRLARIDAVIDAERVVRQMRDEYEQRIAALETEASETA